MQAGEMWRLGVEHSERGYFYVEAVGARPDGGAYLLGPFPRVIADEVIANHNEVRVLREALEKISDLPITDPLASAYDIACEALTHPHNVQAGE